MRRAHDALWRRFFDEQSRLCYDVEFTDAAQFPTPDEIRALWPSCAGWITGMEDCCLTAGFVLDAMVTAHRVTGEVEWAEKARSLFAGLVSLGTVSKTRGFVARGFAPGRTEIYPNSSADQYTAFVYGIWRYARSGLASQAERDSATRLLVDVAEFVERHGHTIPREDGSPSIYGDVDSFSPDRACRLLQFYKAAYDLSRDPHWQDLYQQKAREHGGWRMAVCLGRGPHLRGAATHAVAQSQIAFRLLYECEEDRAAKHTYLEGLRSQARSLMGEIRHWRDSASVPLRPIVPDLWRCLLPDYLWQHPDYDPRDMASVRGFLRYVREHADEALREKVAPARIPPASMGLALRSQTEALAVVMLCPDEDIRREAAAEGRAMLTGVDWSRVGDARVWECLDLAYWRGVEAGVLPA